MKLISQSDGFYSCALYLLPYFMGIRSSFLLLLWLIKVEKIILLFFTWWECKVIKIHFRVDTMMKCIESGIHWMNFHETLSKYAYLTINRISYHSSLIVNNYSNYSRFHSWIHSSICHRKWIVNHLININRKMLHTFFTALVLFFPPSHYWISSLNC